MTEVNDVVTMGTDEADMQQVTAAARGAAPQLARSSIAERAAWLDTVADALDAAGDDLVPIADEETSLGRDRLHGELRRTTGQLRLFGRVIREGSYLDATIDHADVRATPPRPDLRRMLVPLGPVAVFSASNFPFAFSVAGGDTASALAAGCPVVVKAHPGHAQTSVRTATVVGAALLDSGAPAGSFALVEGLAAGRSLVVDPAIRAVGFTGSTRGGRTLLDLVSSRPDPIPFYGELGSLNPVVVTPGAAAANPKRLAEGLVGSVTLGIGQFCTKPGIVLIPSGSDLEDAVAEAMGTTSGGRMLNGQIADGFRSSLDAILDSGRVEVLSGDPAHAVADGVANGLVLATDAADLASADALLEECFGPVTLLVRYADDRELALALDALPGTLVATVHAHEDELGGLGPLVERLQGLAGRVVLGGWPTGVAVNWAQHHGGPWPATTSALHTSVGAAAIRRFLRPVAFQDVADFLLPPALQEHNPLGIPRRVDGELTVPRRVQVQAEDDVLAAED